MKARLRLIPIFAAASIALAGCQESADDAPAADAMAAQATSAAPAAALAQGAPTGGTCGTVAGIQCASDMDFCKTAIGQCDVADAEGTCTTKPQICTMDFNPVCGCDGQTYGNACAADSAGVNVQAVGECAGDEA